MFISENVHLAIKKIKKEFKTKIYLGNEKKAKVKLLKIQKMNKITMKWINNIKDLLKEGKRKTYGNTNKYTFRKMNGNKR